MAERNESDTQDTRDTRDPQQDQQPEREEQQAADAAETPAVAEQVTEQVTEGASDGDPAAQLQAARAEAAQYKDKYLRALAEMDNFRKRQERITGDRTQRAVRDLLEKVLEVMDNLDRAMSYQDTMDREGLQKGLRMVQWQLDELLKNEGLSPVPTVGEPFDPRVHEAVESVTSAEHPEGTVVEEVRKGYMLGDNTLRPARVKVSGGAGA